MLEEGFLKRWSRRKTESRLGQEPLPEPEQAPPQEGAAIDLPAPVGEPGAAGVPGEAPPPLPTLDDVAMLTKDSDFSAFVARGVDAAVRRSALKKLFADPHFSAMDRLDVYIDDYTQASPVPEAMLAQLAHAKKLFERAVDEVLDADAAPAPAPEDEAASQASPQQYPPETETQ